jgi:hypothetical protein
MAGDPITGRPLSYEDPDGRSITHKITTTNAHHKIHEGNHFFTAGESTLSSAGNKLRIQVTSQVAGDDVAHFRYPRVDIDKGCKVRLYEGSTLSETAAAAATITNRNRNSPNTAGISIQVGVTTASGTVGTLLLPQLIGSGKKSGGESWDQGEIMMKNDTKYLVEIETLENTAILTWAFDWYES